MEFLRPAHGADEGKAALLGERGDGELRGDGVDGVDDVVEASARRGEAGVDELFEVLGEHEGVARDDAAGGVDVAHHRGHDVDLACAHGALEGDGLAIDVRGRDDVDWQHLFGRFRGDSPVSLSSTGDMQPSAEWILKLSYRCT